MNEELQDGVGSAAPEAPADVVSLIKKMQQQLTYLEKKIDALIVQLQQRPPHERPAPEKRFEKSFRSYDRPRHHERYGKRKERDGGPEERSFRPGRHFEKHHHAEGQGFGGHQESFDRGPEGGSGQDRRFKKKFGSRERGFDPRKKPFFRGRRD